MRRCSRHRGYGMVENLMDKVAVSASLMRGADRCVQVMGGKGVTSATIVDEVFGEIRAFRIYDGPDRGAQMVACREDQARLEER